MVILPSRVYAQFSKVAFRCPLKSQNEGYLLYLLEEYWSQARKVFKAENRGELKHGKFAYSRSRAKKRFVFNSFTAVTYQFRADRLLKIDEHPEEYKKMSEAVETIFNKESSKSKIRGHDGYVNKARSHKSAAKCLKEKVITEILSSSNSFSGV